MNPSDRKRSLFFLGLATLAILLLAMGLSRVPFNTSHPLRLNVSAEEREENALTRPISLTGIFYLFIALYLLALGSIFLTREGRLRLVALIVMMSLAYLCVYTVAQFFKGQELSASIPTVIFGETPESALAATEEITPLGEETLSTPEWLITGVGIGLAAAVALAFAAALWLLSQRQPAFSIAAAISEKAKTAVEELEAGSKFVDVIIRCYAQMNCVLEKQRNLKRQAAMTPREFEQVLIRMGFPPEPVQSLTRLFEEVRYGDVLPGESKVESALRSLRAIVAHCESLEQR